ncbi:hypothetical protein GCM10023086_77310 [Streptomyces venetus]|uniref:Transposase n=1 Tax=Streptomyces venetus TaxID=1701086 RepID=A0ABP8HMD0_9ACTN
MCQGIIHEADAAPPYRPLRHRSRPPAAPWPSPVSWSWPTGKKAPSSGYAAGGGQATGAICLYLMHLRRGEWRDAKYWAGQLDALEREPCQYAPVG